MSPRYPKSYPRRTRCIWHLNSTPESFMSLHFSEFEIQPHHTCSRDYVSVLDGSTQVSRVISTSCGRNLPVSVSSSTNKMTIIFMTDGHSNEFNGFRAQVSVGRGCELKLLQY